MVNQLISDGEREYVIRVSESEVFALSKEEMALQRIPIRRFENEQNGKPLELCIWDVGQVIIKYSFGPLFALAAEHSQEPQLVMKRLATFDYHTYMRGACDFRQFCGDFCRNFGIKYRPSIEKEIEQALIAGIQGNIGVVRKAIEAFDLQMVNNAVLSNALPFLADKIDGYDDLIPPEMRFFSFEMGCLKPNEMAWKMVLDVVGVDPSDALFIDDQSKNIQASIGLGVAGILFDPKTFRRDLKYQLPKTFDHSLLE